MITSMQDVGSQADFTFRIHDMGRDELRVTGFDGREAFGELFEFRVDICGDELTHDLATLLGKQFCPGVCPAILTQC